MQVRELTLELWSAEDKLVALPYAAITFAVLYTWLSFRDSGHIRHRPYLATGGAAPPKPIIPEPILGLSIKVLIQ